MKVVNDGEHIKIDAEYNEIATILQVLDNHWLSKDDKFVKDLAYHLHNPKVKTKQVVEKSQRL